MEREYNSFTYNRIRTLIFLSAEILLYIGFLYIDITGNASYTLSNYLKFTGIILCFLFTLFLPCQKRADIIILRAALLFTLISDLFILIMDYYIWGVVTFYIVQTLYLIRLGLWKNQLELKGAPSGRIIKKFMRNIITSICILILIAFMNIKMEVLIILSCFYFVSILFNTAGAVWTAFKSKVQNRIIFAAGMVLFLLCDINVGLFNLSDFLIFNSGQFSVLTKFSAVAMWLFYLPAQVCICLSGLYPNNMKDTSVIGSELFSTK